MPMPGQMPYQTAQAQQSPGGDSMPSDAPSGDMPSTAITPQMVEQALNIIVRSGKGKLPEHPGNFAVEFSDTMASIYQKKFKRPPSGNEIVEIQKKENELLKQYYGSGPIDWDTGEPHMDDNQQGDMSDGSGQPDLMSLPGNGGPMPGRPY